MIQVDWNKIQSRDGLADEPGKVCRIVFACIKLWRGTALIHEHE
jgi:hypothetical protein